jgi:hypothetical protein
LSERPNVTSDAKAPAKTKNCVFRLINVLFSDEMSPKFVQLGEKKDKTILDSGLAANNEYFWQEVVEKFQQTNVIYDCIAFTDPMFSGVDPSIKVEHSWSKLREIYKALTKSYGEVFDNHKKSGNHDDFINFCGSRSDVYYLHLWLGQKPQLETLVVIDLPEDVFYDTAAPASETRRRPSPTFSNNSGRSALVDSVNALVEERKKSRESKEQDMFQLKFNEEKLKMQVSHNYDENVKRLIDVKRQLESETNPSVKKILKKYEKKPPRFFYVSGTFGGASCWHIKNRQKIFLI